MPGRARFALGSSVAIVLSGLACGDDIPSADLAGTSGLALGAVTVGTSTGTPAPAPTTAQPPPPPVASSGDGTAPTDSSDTGPVGDSSGGSSSSGESTGGDADRHGTYDDCANLGASTCEADAECWLDDPVMPSVGVCAPTECTEDDDCPVVDGSDAPPWCTDLDGDGATECALACSGGTRCPGAMVCHDDTTCAHAVQPPAPCTDIDLGSALPATATGTTLGAGDEFAPVCTMGNSEELVLEWTAPADGFYEIATAGSTFDTILYALSTCDGAPLACNDDAGPIDPTSVLVVELAVGETVLAVVDGFNNTGEYTLSIDAVAFDGDCCQPHDDVGCEVPAIEACVCADDNYCCIAAWDDLCVDKAVDECGATCPP